MTIFADDFEANDDFATWTDKAFFGGDPPVITAEKPFRGIYGAKCVVNLGWYCAVKKTIAGTPITHARAYSAYDAFPNEGDQISSGIYIRVGSDNFSVAPMLKQDGGDIYWGLLVSENAVPTIYWEAVPSNPITGKYYGLEVKRDVTNGLQELWVDGISRASANVAITQNSTEIMIGFTYNGILPSITNWIDNVIVDTDYIGLDMPMTGIVTGYATLG